MNLSLGLEGSALADTCLATWASAEGNSEQMAEFVSGCQGFSPILEEWRIVIRSSLCGQGRGLVAYQAPCGLELLWSHPKYYFSTSLKLARVKCR